MCVCVGLAVLAAAGAVGATNEPAGQRPNILYIFTDQQFAGAMSCAGNPYVKTPAMDSLAANGMRFTEAYTASPVCSPARASMLTGLYPHEHGVIVNDLPIRADRLSVCIEHLMAARGYECLYAGKWHLPGGRTLSEADLKRHPYRVLSAISDTAVSDACVRFFAEKRDRPFFLVASYLNPHDICEWPKPLEKGKPVSQVENPPPLPPNFAVPANEPRIMRGRYMSRHTQQQALTGPLWRQYLAAYYRCIEEVDAQIGKLLAALRAAGLEDKTVIFFSSDHGDGMAAHQWLQKCTHYEEATRVPFIVSYKGVTKAGAMDKTHLVASCQDFYATALDYAGASVPAGCSGRSVRVLAEGGKVKSWRDQIVSEIWVPGNRPKQGEAWTSAWGRMVRTTRYKYALYNEGEHREVLLDMENDRLEMHNLATVPKYEAVLKEHRRRLAEWCKATKDEAFMPFLIP